MSLSRPNLKNPATRFMQWGGGADNVGTKQEPEWEGGKVSYWDKEANDGEGENIEVALPLTFIVLDELHTITGFNQATKSGFWSNEIRDLANDTLVVRNKSGIVAKGKYADIKDEIKSDGAKYTKSIYIAFYNEEKELVLGHLKLSGAAMSTWIEFTKKVDVSKAAVTLDIDPNVKKNGNINYFVPKFGSMKISQQTLQAATKLDADLQDYLDAYLSRKPDTEETEYATSAEELDAQGKKDVEIEDIEEPVTLGDGTPVDDNEADEPNEPQTPAPKPAAKAKATKEPHPTNLNDVEF
jgi:hypothetical protein